MPTIYNDGASHTLSSGTISDGVIVTNGSTLTVSGTAVITGADADGIVPTPGTEGIAVDDGSTLVVNGGTISGGHGVLGNDTPNAAIRATGITVSGTTTGSITITGGTITGGSASFGGNAAPGVVASGNATTSISGGSINGGSVLGSAGDGGHGLVLGLSNANTASITGGSISGGSGTHSTGLAANITVLDSSHVTTSGGVFTGDMRFYCVSTGKIDFTGFVTYVAPLLSGNLTNGDAINSNVAFNSPTLSEPTIVSGVRFAA